ncbi:family with sequence similarity 187 member B [Chelydra serpentina]|uniref:Family with sequence similarity 187 member B n=1 Tax=Chelydra serpentina TaxID=8475 RepID=A0A8T1S159_CHESE|nr:family with sequence similarity 187 member B [Chelydra serpentina]
MCPRAVALSFLFALISAVAKPCLPGRPCTLALISDNPVTLRCPGAPHQGPVSWQYVDPSQLWQLRLKTRLLQGDLRILDPGVGDSGVYTCRRGDAVLAYYEISHASLGEAALANTTVDLAGGARGLLFTAWARWQPCDRCGGPGERKRVGFCYARLASRPEGALPCGVAGRGLPQRGPELRVESCEVPCDGAYAPSRDELGRAPLLVITRYRALPHARARLRCPTASIYSPVYWQEGPTALTWLDLHQRNGSIGLDKATGGGTLLLSSWNGTKAGYYQCYVGGRLVGRFLVTPPRALAPAPELTRAYSAIESLVVGLSIFLIFLLFFSILQSCRRKPGAIMA